jgi:pimeloyl-ACP methyl ester carboxylesterase
MITARVHHHEVEVSGLRICYRHAARFPEIQDYHRTLRPPTLILWGVHDPYFDLEEVLAYHRDLPTAETHLLDAGHYLLETHGDGALALIKPFIARSAAR